jgi:hypothetical protein
METNPISEAFLDEQIQAVTDDLLVLYQNQDDEQHLKLTGLEIFVFLGAKVAIPVIAGFIDKALYDKYVVIRTRKLAQEARDELLRTYQPSGDPVDQAKVENEVIESLVEEGIPLEHAKLVVSNAINRIKDQLS